MEQPRALLSMHRRVISVLLPGTESAEEASRRMQLALGGGRPADPARGEHDYFYESREAEYRRLHPECDRVVADVQARLRAIDPARLIAYGTGVIYDFTGLPELHAAWHAVHEKAYQAWRTTLPPLPVAVGDFVEVGGCVLRIRAVNLERRTADTERIDAGGRAISSIPGAKAEGLRPLAGPVDVTRGWPEPPDTLRDGLARARWVMRTHQRLLEAAGLVPRDD